jgi:hypothetical protein
VLSAAEIALLGAVPSHYRMAVLEDGVNNRFDTALVISADSNLCPAIRALNRLRPALRVVAAFPRAIQTS